jgi:ubiquinone/menaquinone biosynthesis C-methylase UbiE
MKMPLPVGPSPSKEFIRRRFDRQAKKFSAWSVTKNNDYAEGYYGFCRMTPQDRLLDVSCGSGEFCIFCARRITSATGVDLSENMIDLAKKQSAGAGITNTQFFRGDAANLSEQSGIYSIVVSKSAFHHYTEHDDIFEEMKRCCEPGGRISVQDIAAYGNKAVNDFFESLERLVDASHKATCSTSFIRELYQRHRVGIVAEMEIGIDLNLCDYLGHALRSEKDAQRLEGLIREGLEDPVIKNYFYHNADDLFFKRNVFLILGEKD